LDKIRYELEFPLKNKSDQDLFNTIEDHIVKFTFRIWEIRHEYYQ